MRRAVIVPVHAVWSLAAQSMTCSTSPRQVTTISAKAVQMSSSCYICSCRGLLHQFVQLQIRAVSVPPVAYLPPIVNHGAKLHPGQSDSEHVRPCTEPIYAVCAACMHKALQCSKALPAAAWPAAATLLLLHRSSYNHVLVLQLWVHS